MNAIRRQFFCSFAVLGAFVPYLSVWLSERGLRDGQIGYVLATAGVAVMVSPLFTTLLADTRVERRWVLGGLMLAVAASAAGLLGAGGSWWGLTGVYLVFAAALTPVLPLQDAVLFAAQAEQSSRAENQTPYHHVRAWGTAGFIVPSLGLWAWLHDGGSLDATLAVTAGFAVLGAVNAAGLPRGGGVAAAAGRDPLEPDRDDAAPSGPREEPAPGKLGGVPTLAALRSVARPDAIVFAAAVWLLYATITAYHGFYPRLLTERPEAHGAGIDPSLIGLISNLGVLVELPLMLCFGWLLRRLGLRRLMAIGAAFVALRMGLLAWSAAPASAIGSQLFHGVSVLAVHVAPPVFVNRFAHERFRGSIQGVYVVLVTGTARIVGSATAGEIADVSLRGVFVYAMLMSAAAAGLFAVAFRPKGHAAGVEA